MIQNMVFDFGNVLGWTDANHTTATYVDREEDGTLIRNVVFDPVLWDKLNRGSMNDEDLISEIHRYLPECLHREACTVM